MTHILPSGSYLRCSHSQAPRQNDAVLVSLCERYSLGPPEAARRIWELLETPQTVETLCRVLAREYSLPRSCGPQIRSFLGDLYERDLIQVSPDT